ncbi:hypothetical protein [Pilibacter termitis]|uniref:hypothetical protein n=1 Tax=Pilibacter termitis TaxID=263852 RepID=UPI0013564C66|nr:hypothetical protein [Pilibacter termitis]
MLFEYIYIAICTFNTTFPSTIPVALVVFAWAIGGASEEVASPLIVAIKANHKENFCF